MIELIEAHSFLSTPADKEEIYDSWLLRFSASPIKRANSVNFPTTNKQAIPLADKIQYCENAYFNLNKACIFRITPLALPSDLRAELKKNSYVEADPTDVLLMNIANMDALAQSGDCKLVDRLNEREFEDFCRLTGKQKHYRGDFANSLKNTKIPTLFAYKEVEQQIVSVGMATYAENLLGLFEFATHPLFQRKGYALEVLLKLLQDGYRKGATKAYAQVVQQNLIGQKFWRAAGFNEELYSYVYYIKTEIPT
ncbi:GNAT family N-acetyltransferase [Sneathiella glossodoripedis]|uniref:GNAT family N-acetyltransferase n=1 Tax=Sneathiella glossodoripedis TaxID=418853 RepID=UPI000470EB97|nr:GNAT family N-acetyltransferase [Sneathiella glossodoripedis]